jgi:hypothetical protein
MNRKLIFGPLLLALCSFVLAGAGSERVRREAGTLDLEPSIQTMEQGQTVPNTNAPSFPTYVVKRLTVQHGAALKVYSANYGVGLSVGQNAAGKVNGTDYNIGLGFWYGMEVCPVSLTGDVNEDGGLSPTDVVYLVNVVFKTWPDPLPCRAAGDVNCSGTISTGDIILMVNHVFKAGPAPCNVCGMIPSPWTCP